MEENREILAYLLTYWYAGVFMVLSNTDSTENPRIVPVEWARPTAQILGPSGVSMPDTLEMFIASEFHLKHTMRGRKRVESECALTN